MDRFVLYFPEIDHTSLAQVGGKGANLGEMAKAEFPVPEGFCVTTRAYQTFLATSTEIGGLLARLDDITADDLDAIRQLGSQIRDHLLSLPIPVEIEAAVVEAWTQTGSGKAYAVRSSATAEDLPTASFAGQQETYLNVIGRGQLLDAIRRCWASLFTDRAISYRIRNGFDHRHVLLSVVVQEMVFPEVSGILFTADPLSGNRRLLTIDASFGLGEALVSGMVTADAYHVRDGQITEKKLAKKKLAIYANQTGGTVTQDIPVERQDVQALSDAQITELALLGKQIEAHYRREQDIEWCLTGGKFYIVQSRPITSLYPIPQVADDRLHVFVSLGHQQMMTDAMTPLGISVLRTLFPFEKWNSIREESPVVLEAGSHLFFDPTDLLYMNPAKRLLPKMLVNIDERIGSAVAEVVARPDFVQPVDERVKRPVHKAMRAVVKNVVPRMMFSDFAGSIAGINKFIDQLADESERTVFQVSGKERIERIQDNLGNLILSVIREIGPYLAVGVSSMMMSQALIRRWLGEDERLPQLNKSLPGNVTSELGLMIGDLADIARLHPDLVRYFERMQDADKPQVHEGRELRNLDKGEAQTHEGRESWNHDKVEPETHAVSAPSNCGGEGGVEAGVHGWKGMKGVDGGIEFATALDAFLRKYGMRCPGEIEIATSRWRESPQTLLPSILNSVHTLTAGEHRARYEAGRTEAEVAASSILSDVRKRRFGLLKVRVLRRLIRNYRTLAGLREHPKYIIVRHFDIYKRAILEEAERLVDEGLIRQPSDVFYLSLGELRDVLDGSGSALDASGSALDASGSALDGSGSAFVRRRPGDIHGLIEQRRKTYEQNKKLTPPRVMTSEGEIVTGTRRDVQAPSGALLGTAASAGVVEGYAKVVLRPEEAKLNPGEILIAPFTDPGWTPLFHSAKGLVMEVGGMLTHGSVVAREYGIPAVVGIDDATKVIQNGDFIRVDGNKGYVQILSAAQGTA